MFQSRDNNYQVRHDLNELIIMNTKNNEIKSIFLLHEKQEIFS